MSKEKKSRLEKATAILGIVFLVSTGLCGANFIAVSQDPMRDSGSFLVFTGIIELWVMAMSGVGLLVVGLIAMTRALIDSFSSHNSDLASIIEKDEEKE